MVAARLRRRSAAGRFGVGRYYFPIVNASTTDFTHPFTMTIQGNPAHRLFPQIKLQHLIGNPANVPDNQLWGSEFGTAN
jgi:hypothetical protein